MRKPPESKTSMPGRTEGQHALSFEIVSPILSRFAASLTGEGLFPFLTILYIASNGTLLLC